MKKILASAISSCLLASITFNANCQIQLNTQKKLTITLPKSLYFEPSVKSFSLLNNVKAQLKLYPDKQFQKSPSSSPFPNSFIKEFYSKNLSLAIIGKAQKIGSNELFDFYGLPLDNMVCEVPNNKVTSHANIYNPTAALDYPADNIPNALPKVNVIK